MVLKEIVKVNWRRFLASDAGVEGMLFLREEAPIVVKGPPHEVQFDAGYSMGYIHALDVLSKFVAEEPKRDVDIENR